MGMGMGMEMGVGMGSLQRSNNFTEAGTPQCVIAGTRQCAAGNEAARIAKRRNFKRETRAQSTDFCAQFHKNKAVDWIPSVNY